MEHKLISGEGAQFLPFARSRIKALKATGLKYASQKFEIDGVSVKVRIAGEHEYIAIEGGTTSLEMDSGVMEVFNIAELNPGTYLPGNLLEDGSAKPYCAAFTADSARGPGRTNPGQTSAGQLAGVITKGTRFLGRVLGQKSFLPLMRDSIPATNPPSKEPDPKDDTLRAKKIASLLCPASVFTGRCRLYVQAMYGVPLYEYDKRGNLITVNDPPEVLSATSSAPALWIKPYVSMDENGEYPRMLLDTNCGVWLDPDDGKHWLFKFASEGVRVYPLRSSPAGEKLRHHLVTTSGKNLLNSQDKEHLEAYILAYSRPDTRRLQIASASWHGGYSMGYGWHWNWTGDTADIVVHTTFEQSPTNSAMRSSHFRSVVKKVPLPEPVGGFAGGDSRNAWEVTQTTLILDKDWSVYRVWWSIAEPDFANSILMKSTPKKTIVMASSGVPIYAFYVRNELKLCTISVSLEEASEATREMSDNYGAPGFGADVSHNTIGDYAGYLEDLQPDGASYVLSVSCGGFSESQMYAAKGSTGIRYELKDKSFLGMTGLDGFLTSYGTWVAGFPTGYPPHGNTGPFAGRLTDVYTGMYSYSLSSEAVSEADNSLMAIAVPLYDAEAIYIRTSKTHTRTRAGTTQERFFDYKGCAWRQQISKLNDAGDGFDVMATWYSSYPGGPSSNSNTYSPPVPTAGENTITGSEQSVFVGHGGILPATFQNLGMFHNNAEDFISSSFQTRTSASDIAPVIHAPGYLTPPVSNSTNADRPVIVGWV